MKDSELTIRISLDLLENARDFAKQNNTTLDILIGTYLRQITATRDLENAPIVTNLIGSLSRNISIDDYKRHLELKYDKQT